MVNDRWDLILANTYGGRDQANVNVKHNEVITLNNRCN